MPYKDAGGRLEPLYYEVTDIIRLAKEKEVRFIDLQFTSLFGKFHHVTITADALTKEAIEDGFPKLDGSSIKGFTEVHESDMLVKPDPNTFAVIPWNVENKTARLICDIYWGYNRERLSRDPRAIAQRAEEFLKSEGFKQSYWGPELEFFVFDNVSWNTQNPLKGVSYSIESKEIAGLYPLKAKEGYMPADPADTLTDFRNECARALAEFGIICEGHHHEVATGGQCELDMRFDTLTCAADSSMTYKYVVKNIARRYNLIATMMPKPLANDNGSGMHVNVSLWNDKNEFYDPNDEYAELSQIGRYFGGGIMEHASALSAIVAPTTNSYRRLVPGYEAPVYVAWSMRNRSAIIRIPAYFKGEKFANSKRIEYRAADPSCNPYLCFAAVLSAGLDGIRKKKDIGDPVDEDIYKMSAHRRRQLGIGQLPSSLSGAADCLESDHEFLKPVFTEDVIQRIIEVERKQEMSVSSIPHPYEFHLYFDV